MPTRYTLDLTIDPGRDTFHGKAVVDVVTQRPTSEVRLHAEGLAFWSSSVSWDETTVPAQALPTKNGGLVVRWEGRAPAGPLRLAFTYDAPYLEVAAGVFRVRRDGHAYVFTQFEAIDARRGFPCFDQPEFKTPFEVTLRVPRGQAALANGVERARERDDAHDVVTFAPTPPLPTYLVAFAVGPLDVVPSTERADLRVAAPRGGGASSGLALRRTPRLLGALEAYFGTRHPYPKLDLLAVPTLGGAMENAGLVTFADHILLVDERSGSVNDRVRLEAVTAHELAHSWFGNSVTLTWWDDLWLNEAFATWMQARINDEVAPSYQEGMRAQERTRAVMHLDAQPSARAVRQPIRHGGDVENAFDGITYVKGAALLRMVEGWVTPGVLRDALRGYVAEHREGHATTEQLFDRLDRATGKAVSSVLRGFVDRPGLPWIRMQRAQGPNGAVVKLRQLRAGPHEPEPLDEEPWHVPVCVRFDQGDDASTRCVLLDGVSAEIPLPDGAPPAWVMPNAEGLGYYRWDLAAADWQSLVDASDRLTPEERASLPDQLGRSLVAGTLAPSHYLRLLASLARHEDRFVVQGVLTELTRTSHACVAQPDRPAFRRYVEALLEPHVRRVGYERKPDEPVSHSMLRPWLLQTYGDLSRDEELAAHARAYATELFQSPERVDAAAAETWLPLAARGGQRAMWEALLHAVARTKDPSLRSRMVVALGSFETPELLRASLDLVLDGQLEPSDFPYLARGWSSRPEVQALVWDWMVEHHERLARVMGESAARGFPGVASGFCDAQRAREVAAFFADARRWPPGTQRHVELTVQAIERCARTRERLSGSMGRALEAR